MLKKLVILAILAIILGIGIFFIFEKKETAIKETSIEETYTDEKLRKIKALKGEGKALCDSGKLEEGEAKLIEAITIISFTMLK